MRSPKLLIAASSFGLLLIMGALRVGHHTTKAPEQKATTSSKYDVSEGDTNNEVLNQILAEQSRLKAENKRLLESNKDLESQNSSKRFEAISQLKKDLEMQIANIKQKTVAKSKDSESYPLEDGVGGQSGIISRVDDIASATAVMPDKTENTTSGSQSTGGLKEDDPDERSIYSIPDGATIGNINLMSPLIAEVPVNGVLQEPAFPFKAIISYKDTQKMLAANHVPLPDGLAGSILQGYSVGNQSLSCARAYVDKILFVFQDGHFSTMPSGVDGNQKENKTIHPQSTLGYISDQYGNPCIAGEYLTDAPKVIASLAALGASAGVGQAISQAQQQAFADISTGTSGVVFNGNLAKFAGGTGVGNAAQEALNWYKSRVNNIFDVVLVKNTLNNRPRKVVFNVTKTININFNQDEEIYHGKTSQVDTIDSGLN